MIVLGAAGGGGKVTVTVLVTSSVDVTVAAVWVDPPPQPARTIAAPAIRVVLACIEKKAIKTIPQFLRAELLASRSTYPLRSHYWAMFSGTTSRSSMIHDCQDRHLWALAMYGLRGEIAGLQ